MLQWHDITRRDYLTIKWKIRHFPISYYGTINAILEDYANSRQVLIIYTNHCSGCEDTYTLVLGSPSDILNYFLEKDCYILLHYKLFKEIFVTDKVM